MRFVLSLSTVLTILFVCPGAVQGQVHVGQLVPDAAPGGQFSLTGDSLPGKRIEASLAREGASHTILPVAIDQSQVTFRVPDGLAPAAYLLRVKINDEALQFAGQLTVTSAIKAAPVSPAIHRTLPTASWIKLWFHGLYDMDILGERLPASAGELPTDKSVLLDFDQEPLGVKACAPASEDAPRTHAIQTEPCYAMHTAQRLAIHGLRAKVRRPAPIRDRDLKRQVQRRSCPYQPHHAAHDQVAFPGVPRPARCVGWIPREDRRCHPG